MKKKRESNADVENESTESCDDNQNKLVCTHSIKSVDLNKVKKTLKSKLETECADCLVSANSALDDGFEYDLSLWMCLKCGHQACGRAKNKHALKHYETPRSDPHALCVNTTTWIVWCYACDEEVGPDSRKKLLEAVEYIKKQFVTTPKKIESEPPVFETIEVKAPETKGKKVLPFIPKVRGLTNLGNTCFFNAVLQCLAQTPFLLPVLKEMSQPGEKFKLPGGTLKLDEKSIELPPIEGELSKWGILTEVLAQTLEELQFSGNTGVFNPRQLHFQLSRKLPQFGGGDQEDSHELLRHLLEAVRTEDLQRYQAVILRELGLKDKKDRVAVDEEAKQKIKFYGRQASDMMLRPEQVFRGFLVSTLQCQHCSHSSNRDEYFLDLSLPVMADKPQPPVMRRKSELDEENKPSKHQLKKERKAARKGHKNNKALKSNSGEAITEESSQTVNNSESEQSDADVEDNIEEGAKNNRQNGDNTLESGYNSEEKKDFPEKTEHEKNKFSPTFNQCDIVTQNNSRNLSTSNFREIETNTASILDNLDKKIPDGTSSKMENIACEKTANIDNGSKNGSPETHGKKADQISSPNQNDYLLSINVSSLESQGHTSSVSPNYSVSPVSSEVIDLSSPRQTEGSPEADCDRPTGSWDTYNEENIRVSPDDDSITPKKTVLNINEIARITIEKKLGGMPDNDSNKLEETASPVIALGWKEEEEATPLLNSHSQSYNLEAPSPKEILKLNLDENKALDYSVSNYTAPSREYNSYNNWNVTVGSRYSCSDGECSIQSCLNQFTSVELMTGNNKVCCEACTERINGKGGKSVNTNSTKQLLISSPPAILILHLKRFQVFRSLYRKMSKDVSFPLVLDLAPFCSNKCKVLPSINNQQNKLLYSLYGVVEHNGTLHGGHYVAYVKARMPLDKNDSRWQFLPKGNKSEGSSGGSENVDDDETVVEPGQHQDGATGVSNPEPPEGKWYYVSDSHVSVVSENKVLSAQAYLLFYERIL